jgi:L-lactate dehydrogenase (cytochrome)
MPETSLVPTSHISKHNTPEDCWIVVNDEIWDVTDLAQEHPGGAASTCCPLPSNLKNMGALIRY